MNNQEFDKIISRLSAAFVYNKFAEVGVIGEYKRALMKYNFEQINRAIDILIESTDGKNAPSISQLIRVSKENRSASCEIVNKTYCEVCDDKGFVLLTEMYMVSDKLSIPYDYVLYCPFCAVGQNQAYIGNNCKDHKSNYACEPITKYFDEIIIQDMRNANRRKRETVISKGVSLCKERLL